MHRRPVAPLALPLALLVALVLAPAWPAAAAADRLPDLRLARLADLAIDTTSAEANGRRLLRFTTVIVNVGAGAFEVHATRSSATSTGFSSVAQRVYNDARGYRDAPVAGAALIWGGDGHNHWHLRDLQQFVLSSPTNASIAPRFGAKVGFCFYDNVRYNLKLAGAKHRAAYTASNACGHLNDLDVMMGLSIGWGDRYAAPLRGQYVDITGLPAGDYRLRATADAKGQFLEASDANNETWADLRLGADGRLTVLGYGPSA
jgi:Lysyl oxidase